MEQTTLRTMVNQYYTFRAGSGEDVSESLRLAKEEVLELGKAAREMEASTDVPAEELLRMLNISYFNHRREGTPSKDSRASARKEVESVIQASIEIGEVLNETVGGE